MRCSNCHAELEPGARFCGSCGTPVQVQQEKPPVKPVPPKKPGVPFRIPKKFLAIGAGALAVILVVVLAVSVFSGGGKESVFYIKDREILLNDFSKEAPYELTSRLVSDSDVYNEDLADAAYKLSVRVDEKMTKAIYVDRISDDNWSLYLRDLKKLDKDPVKIDSGITRYYVNDKLDQIIYLKGDSLYRSDMKEKEKIASDVSSFFVSEDMKIIYYLNKENDVYLIQDGQEKEKVATAVSSRYFSDDFKTLYYLTEDSTLYKKAIGEDKEKIARDVYNVYVDQNGVYFYGNPNRDITDYIVNDMEDMEDWESYFEGETFSSFASLYYYNGKETMTVSEAATVYTWDYSSEKITMVYRECNPSDIPSVSLSEIVDAYYEEAYYSLSSAAWDMLYEMQKDVDVTYCLLTEGQSIDLGLENATHFDIAPDGSSLLYLQDYDFEIDCGDLYEIEISGGKIKAPELVENDVFMSVYMEDGILLCWKDCDFDENTADLYIDGECVDYDVPLGRDVGYDKDTKTFYYMVDYDEDRECGTLKCYKSKKPETVADDVIQFTILGDGRIMYLYDYSLNTYYGDLCLYEKGDKTLVDSEVVAYLDVIVGAGYGSF